MKITHLKITLLTKSKTWWVEFSAMILLVYHLQKKYWDFLITLIVELLGQTVFIQLETKENVVDAGLLVQLKYFQIDSAFLQWI